MTTVECAGFCTTGAAPSLVSAALTNDGRQILLRFDAAVYATSHQPRWGWRVGGLVGTAPASVDPLWEMPSYAC